MGTGTNPGSVVLDGDLKWSTDFRSVYATLLGRWLGLPAEEVLGGLCAILLLLEA